MEKCELEGDNTNCESCIYYPEFEWDKKKGFCAKRIERRVKKK